MVKTIQSAQKHSNKFIKTTSPICSPIALYHSSDNELLLPWSHTNLAPNLGSHSSSHLQMQWPFLPYSTALQVPGQCQWTGLCMTLLNILEITRLSVQWFFSVRFYILHSYISLVYNVSVTQTHFIPQLHSFYDWYFRNTSFSLEPVPPAISVPSSHLGST